MHLIFPLQKSEKYTFSPFFAPKRQNYVVFLQKQTRFSCRKFLILIYILYIYKKKTTRKIGKIVRFFLTFCLKIRCICVVKTCVFLHFCLSPSSLYLYNFSLYLYLYLTSIFYRGKTLSPPSLSLHPSLQGASPLDPSFITPSIFIIYLFLYFFVYVNANSR